LCPVIFAAFWTKLADKTLLFEEWKGIIFLCELRSQLFGTPFPQLGMAYGIHAFKLLVNLAMFVFKNLNYTQHE
jgi:hypothetical protein